MKSILIISDTHRWEEELQIIMDRHQDVDIALHCGDSELKNDDPSIKDYHTVNGNCDVAGSFPNEIIFEHGGLTILVTHGHLFDVKNSLIKLNYRAQEVSADVVCFGHSHIAFAENTNDRLFINPGSIRLPRYFSKGSYCILKWERTEAMTLKFYDINGDILSSLPYADQFSLK